MGMVLPICALKRDCDLRRVHGSFVIVKVMRFINLRDRLGVLANARMGFTPARDIGKRMTIVGLGEGWARGRRLPEQ